MSELFYEELLCEHCNNFRMIKKNKKGEKVFYCITCDKEIKIPSDKEFLVSKEIKKDEHPTEVPVIKTSKKQNNRDDRIDYWDLGHPDI